MEATKGISIVIPTLNGGDVFSRCLQSIGEQDYDGSVELVVVDSGSTDGTPARAKESGAKVSRIDPGDFHHARTRNWALQHVSFDRVVYIVQDAIPAAPTWLKTLDRLLLEHQAVAAYGRPIAREGASVYGRFTADGTRRYLGTEPRLQELADAHTYARMDFDEAYRVTRLDNVCAVYRRDALAACPFPDVPYAEDMAWALQRLLAGFKILYDPSVEVRHSHERSAAYTFRRHLVDAVYCAEILGKLRFDLSALTVEELIHLAGWMNSRLENLLADEAEEISRRPKKSPMSSARIGLFRFFAATPSIQKRYLEPGRSGQPHTRGANAALLAEATSRAGAEIDYLWNFVKKSYTVAGRTEVRATLEKIAASVLGKFFGDAYAGRAAHGTLDAEFREFMEPLLKGV
jgi:glycosyltransferase involved in cell wall biosynthesis